MKKFSYDVVRNFINHYYNETIFLRLGQAFMNDFNIDIVTEIYNLYNANNIKAEKIILANYVNWEL